MTFIGVEIKFKRLFLTFLLLGKPLTHFDVLAKEIKKVAASEKAPVRILDLGAGSGHYWQKAPLLNLRIQGEVLLTLADAIEPELFKKQTGITRIKLDVNRELELLSSSSFDIVIAFDLIEHLSKEEGYHLLYQMERITSNLFGIYTPNGFSKQAPSPNNIFNAHISGWTKKDFLEMGLLQTFGHVGWKPWFGQYSQPRVKLERRLIWLLNLLSIHIPSACYAISAWGRKSEAPREQDLE